MSDQQTKWIKTVNIGSVRLILTRLSTLKRTTFVLIVDGSDDHSNFIIKSCQ
jgi:hypothetical protein